MTPGVPESSFFAGLAAAPTHSPCRVRDGQGSVNKIRRTLRNPQILRYPHLMSPFLNPISILAILIAVSIHEAAHGFIALKLGDPTAKYAGRVTLNPIVHLDLIGTLLFLFVGFGWAKPVPVDPRYFKYPKRDSAIVAAAGPVSNLIIAFVAFVILSLLGDTGNGSLFSLLYVSEGMSVVRVFLIRLCASSIFINLALMAFNLLPIAPLDGSRVLHNFIPVRYETQYLEIMEKGPFILLLLIVLESFLPVSILSAWVFGIADTVLKGMEMVVGIF